jgi:hypothetical protein
MPNPTEIQMARNIDLIHSGSLLRPIEKGEKGRKRISEAKEDKQHTKF